MFKDITKHPQLVLKKKFKVDLRPIKFKNKGYHWNMNYFSELNTKTIAPFNNKHLGKVCVILATGTTLDNYIPIKNAIHIGINSIIHYKKVIVDYYFAMDNSRAIHNIPTHFRKNTEEVYGYKPKIQKFFGKVRKGTKRGDIPIFR